MFYDRNRIFVKGKLEKLPTIATLKEVLNLKGSTNG